MPDFSIEAEKGQHQMALQKLAAPSPPAWQGSSVCGAGVAPPPSQGRRVPAGVAWVVLQQLRHRSAPLVLKLERDFQNVQTEFWLMNQ